MRDVSLFDLSGKNALVTGGAIGIGRGCAVALARAGANVAIVDINREVGEKTAQDLQQYGVKTLFIACDVTDKTQVQDMVAKVVEAFGCLDIAVNNAGICFGAPAEACSEEDWHSVMDVNLNGVWLCAQAQGQQMIKQSPTAGKIINIASMCSAINIPGCPPAYDTSKGAVVRLTQNLALQWGRYNINVNSISPSHVMTPMFAQCPLEQRNRIREITPMGYIQRPEDLHGPVVFLGSDASNYFTGQDMMVDGGHTLSTYLTPLNRESPPRVSQEEELIELRKDLDAMGIAYDNNGVKQAPE